MKKRQVNPSRQFELFFLETGQRRVSHKEGTWVHMYVQAHGFQAKEQTCRILGAVKRLTCSMNWKKADVVGTWCSSMSDRGEVRESRQSWIMPGLAGQGLGECHNWLRRGGRGAGVKMWLHLKKRSLGYEEQTWGNTPRPSCFIISPCGTTEKRFKPHKIKYLLKKTVQNSKAKETEI